ncbi:hypothetical protein LX36DRAFT_102748 [Colletotrichum falcatum]|nr:hypothetical protein LX36DRAFT_102748 [Colletotrichum falcatum]
MGGFFFLSLFPFCELWIFLEASRLTTCRRRRSDKGYLIMRSHHWLRAPTSGRNNLGPGMAPDGGFHCRMETGTARKPRHSRTKVELSAS